jgi:membrane protein
MPAKGWKDTLLRVKKQISQDHVSMVAAAMSYYALLAFVPALTSLVLMYAWFANPAEISEHLDTVARFIPSEIAQTIKEQLTALSGQHSNTTLGISAITALLFSTWSASKAATALTEGLNIVYDEQNTRGFIKSNLLAIGLTFLGTILGIVAIGVVVGFPAFASMFNFGETFETLVGVASWVVLLALFSFYLTFAYRYCPVRDKAKWKWVSWGAVIASVLWAIVSAGFSYYASEFGNFNKSYGSMAAIIILMMWFYLSSFVILLGGEINAELEHQTLKDTTRGPSKPLGRRGAEMADTVGKQQGK